jgi:hypothetical protein
MAGVEQAWENVGARLRTVLPGRDLAALVGIVDREALAA